VGVGGGTSLLQQGSITADWLSQTISVSKQLVFSTRHK
jgi:hypothetical protein